MAGPSNWRAGLVAREDGRLGIAVPSPDDARCPCGFLVALDIHWLLRLDGGPFVEVQLAVPACQVNTLETLGGN